MKHISQLLPIDGYYVMMDQSLISECSQSLTHLYQPLIGMQAITLYQTLLNDLPLQNKSSLQTHHTLMNYLDLPLNELLEARQKLEGIGLLKTYENVRDDKRYFIYELLSPLSPSEFFDHIILSELLHHHIGRSKFRLLQERFGREAFYHKGKDITASFQDVFQTFSPTANEELSIERTSDKAQEFVMTEDFSWLELALGRRMIRANDVLTERNKRIISEMMFLYDLTSQDVEKSLLWALTDENVLNVDEFQAACHDLYTLNENSKRVKLVPKQEKVMNESKEVVETNENMSKEDQLIQHFERISPRQLLQDLSNGGRASKRELQMISEIMTSQGLPSPVMNVLIHYVLIQSNMKLSKAYLETIASHWSRAQLKTAREAMTFAKEEINKGKTKRKTNHYYQRKQHKEVIPDWFNERYNNKEQPKKDPQKNDETTGELEERRAKLADLIEQFANEE